MQYDISAFTHTGTVREANQDRILVQNQILLDGFCEVGQSAQCFCFVADGIGGNNAGDVAAQFLLERVLRWKSEQEEFSEESIRAGLEQMNAELLSLGEGQREYYGLSTTLAGVIIQSEQFFILNAGDSPVWLFRNDMFYQLTENHVLNPYENNSPLTSYFGGKGNNLVLQFCTDLREIQPQDIFVICSDGLFKSLKPKQVKAILSSNQKLSDKPRFLLKKLLETGADDNVSCILVEIVETEEQAKLYTL